MITKDIVKIKFGNEYQGKLFAVQGDTGRTYNLQVLDDLDAPINLEGMSLRLYIGNSKEVSYADGEITDAENGKVIVKLFNSQLKYPGVQMAQFVLTNKDGEKVGSKIFDLWIEEGLESGVTSGKNIYVDFEKIDETLKLLKDYDVTLEEAKKVDFSLKVKIEEGTDIRNKLTECKEKAVEIKNSLDKSNADSLQTYKKAVHINQTLKTQTETSTSVKNDLTRATQTAENTKQVLTGEITKANATNDSLTSTNEDAKKTDTNLKNSTSKAENVKNNLDNSRNSAETLKINLDSSISKGNNLKTDLDNSISKVPANITNLEKVINDAKSTNAELKSTNSAATSTDAEAKKTVEILKNLLAQSGQTETSLKEIIASGNLDKYITDPKLQEALKAYATKDELSKIDVTEQLVDYEKTSDVDVKLNKKVDKVVGKDLSSNDFTNEEKEKLANIEDGANKVTKVSQLTNDKNFKTEIEIQELINNSTKLKKEVVTSLPSTGKEDIVYLLKNKNDSNNFYTEYMWIGGRWEIIGDTKVDLTDYAKKSDIKTKLSELIDDENHQTVTNEEKQKLNNIKLSRSATFIIANYDSSENSKAGADYVIQESECTAEIINSFVNKLPVYGGKILLTEGNFNINKNLSINFNKNNTIIEGYGDSTTIIDKFNNTKSKSVIISTGIENCKLLNLNIINGSSINIKGNNNTIQNIKFKHNGNYSSINIDENSSKNILNNVSIESTSKCYQISENSNNNTLTNCTGITNDRYSSVFYILGSNNKFTNCTGTSKYNTFHNDNNMGSNNMFINCVGTSSENYAFLIKGSNSTLTNCRGITTCAKRTAFYLIDSNNSQLLNCIGITEDGSSFNIDGIGVRMIGCLAKIKDTNEAGIILGNDSKYCIILGNHYNSKLTYDFGTNNVFVNNVKLEV